MSEDPHLRTHTATGDVSHVMRLADDISALLGVDDYSDITFVVENQDFHAHKVIMAARCEYFRALLFGGLRESQPDCDRVPLADTTADGFRQLLRYVYSGRVNLVELKEEQLLEQLGLAHRYGFVDYEHAIVQYLKAIINVRNICAIYDVANLYSLSFLEDVCLNFVDRNASDVLLSDSFLSLSENAVCAVISRDSFCAPEAEIFRAVSAWAEANPEEERSRAVACIRLNIMEIPDLLNVVRPSSLVSSDAILDAIDSKHKSRDMELNYRGYLIPEENVATLRHGASVIKGEMPHALLNGDNSNYDLDRGFTRHPIDESPAAGIVIKLGMQCIVNCVRMLLWDKDNRSYSYKIEASMHEDKDWVTVVDHSTYLCRSWQTLYFPKRVVRYLRVVGTNNTVNRVFHVVSLEAYFTEKTFSLEKGILVPTENVATVANCATVTEGVSRSRNALINGDYSSYDWDSGYTCHQLGSGAIVVQLPQPYLIGSIRLLLWDCDDRSYSYYIDVSTDHLTWHRVVDNRNKKCRSWQTITFPPRPVCYVKIVGTHNTANEVFHCVHFECPAQTTTTAQSPSPAGASAPPVFVPPSSTPPPQLPQQQPSQQQQQLQGMNDLGAHNFPPPAEYPGDVPGPIFPRDNDSASNASTHSASSSRGAAVGSGTPGHGHPRHQGRSQLMGPNDLGNNWNPSPQNSFHPLQMAVGYDAGAHSIRPFHPQVVMGTPRDAPPLPPREQRPSNSTVVNALASLSTRQVSPRNVNDNATGAASMDGPDGFAMAGGDFYDGFRPLDANPENEEPEGPAPNLPADKEDDLPS